jgi:hypothetical protein
MRAVGTFFMRVYQIPPDMNEKEKVIGGILNINQFFWVLGGLILGAIVFAGVFLILGAQIGAVMGLLACLSGFPFVIYKKNGLTLYQYLTYKRKFNNKVQKLANIRKEVKF